MDAKVTLDTEGQNMMLDWLFGDDTRTVAEMGAALESHIVDAPATDKTPEQLAVEEWNAAYQRHSELCIVADTLCKPYYDMLGCYDDAPEAIVTLYAMLDSRNVPCRPWDKNFSLNKVSKATRKMNRYCDKMAKAIIAARTAIGE